MKPDATIDQVEEVLCEDPEEGGHPPFEEDATRSRARCSRGAPRSSSTSTSKPGNYAFVCFIADKTGGPPHIVKGMVSEVEVTE